MPNRPKHARNQNRNFEGALLEAIDETLNALSETVKTTIYAHLKNRFNIEKKDIPKRIADFSDALERIFGFGARYLEMLFIKCLYSKIDSTGELAYYNLIAGEATFEEYVYLARRNFESMRRNEDKKKVLQVFPQNLSIHPITAGI